MPADTEAQKHPHKQHKNHRNQNERKMKYSCPRIVQGRLAIEEQTLAQFQLIREFIRICKRDGKWPNPDFGTPVNPRIEALLDEIIQITTEDQKAK